MKTLLCSLPLLSACLATSHPVQRSPLGTVVSSDAMIALIDQPGPVELETAASVDWAVDRGGLLNLDSDAAKAAGLKDGDEPIQVFFHVLRHPTKGTFLVDTGVERELRDDPAQAHVGWLLRKLMHLEKMKFRASLADWLAAHPAPVAGVFFTHLHLDHVSGAADLPAGTALYVGPNEARARAFENLAVKGTVDAELEGKGPLSEWQFLPDPAGRFDGVLDVFGDGSVFALYVPGHTAGSTAYLVRTPKRPVLLTGDACHTRWGWEHQVEPGSFSSDQARSRELLAKLEALVKAHPGVEVRLGHQW